MWGGGGGRRGGTPHTLGIPGGGGGDNPTLFSSGCCCPTLSCHRQLNLFRKFLHISHRFKGSFEAFVLTIFGWSLYAGDLLCDFRNSDSTEAEEFRPVDHLIDLCWIYRCLDQPSLPASTLLKILSVFFSTAFQDLCPATRRKLVPPSVLWECVPPGEQLPRFPFVLRAHNL